MMPRGEERLVANDQRVDMVFDSFGPGLTQADKDGSKPAAQRTPDWPSPIRYAGPILARGGDMKFGQLERREFITLIGGVAAWPLGARAQQPDRVRRIGALIGLLESDPEGQARLGAFRKGLQELGWSVGRNIHIDYRWAGDDTAKLQAYAAELVALKPDVIFAASGTPLAALNRETRTIPIVFANSNDPASDGFVDNWARPGGNISGFPSLRIRDGWKMARIAQGDCATREPRGRHLRSFATLACRNARRD
jgi:hypothetical protein